MATVLRLPAAEVCTLGDGVGRLRATETAVLHVRIGGIRLSDNFVVVKRLADQMIVGAHTMSAGSKRRAPHRPPGRAHAAGVTSPDRERR